MVAEQLRGVVMSPNIDEPNAEEAAETQAGPANDGTEIVVSDATQLVELAWSHDEPEPFTMPPDVPVAHITQDGEYFQTLHQHGWEITDPAQATQAPHIVCSNLAVAAGRGEGHEAVVDFMLHHDSTVPSSWTQADCEFIVNTDAQFYCPEYR